MSNLSLLLTTKNFTLRVAPRGHPFLIPTPVAHKWNLIDPVTLRHRVKAEQALHSLNVLAITTKSQTSAKAIIRNRIRRRICEATYAILRERGYGRDGKKLEGEADEPITASLVYWPGHNVIQAEWNELLQEVGIGVDKFLKLWKKRTPGLDAAASSREWQYHVKELTRAEGKGLSQHGGSSSRRKATTSGSKGRGSPPRPAFTERRDGGKVSWHALNGKVAKIISYPDERTVAPRKNV